MANAATALSEVQRREWDEQGFTFVRGFASADTCAAMLGRVTEIVRTAASLESVDPAIVMFEQTEMPGAVHPEDRVAKVFKIHRDSVFETFAHDERLLDLVGDLLGPEIDVFLSQFIFKNPGAYGQPWHQDSLYFDFTPDHQVGAWLAVSEATLENGCLWVLPGSHREPVHDHIPDQRPGSLHGYMEIVDHDMDGAVPVLMDPGDVLLFDSHLMHRSTDNESTGPRAAMVYHYSPAGTVDRTPEAKRIINDWVPVRRAG